VGKCDGGDGASPRGVLSAPCHVVYFADQFLASLDALPANDPRNQRSISCGSFIEPRSLRNLERLTLQARVLTFRSDRQP
jgi:hypothetical protein